jgi:hypothetical protein
VYDVPHGKPEPPDSSGSKRDRGSFVPVMVVLGFCVTFVLGLVSVAGLAGLYIVAALAAVLGFVAFHYFLWGWWLTNKLRDEEQKRTGK